MDVKCAYTEHPGGIIIHFEKTFSTDDDKTIFKNEFVSEKTFSTALGPAPSPADATAQTDAVSSSSVLMESALDDDILGFAPGSDCDYAEESDLD